MGRTNHLGRLCSRLGCRASRISLGDSAVAYGCGEFDCAGILALGPLRALMELWHLPMRLCASAALVASRASWPLRAVVAFRSFVTIVGLSDCTSAPKIRRSRCGSGRSSAARSMDGSRHGGADERVDCGRSSALGPGWADAGADRGPTDSAGAGSRGRAQKRRQRRSVRGGRRRRITSKRPVVQCAEIRTTSSRRPRSRGGTCSVGNTNDSAVRCEGSRAPEFQVSTGFLVSA
jgi:hypothetical protein